jgi:hypothetical protein
MCGGVVMVLAVSVVLMTTLRDWTSEAPLLRPLAFANLGAACFAVVVGIVRPTPLVLNILLVAALGGPWTFAVIRRAILRIDADADVTMKRKSFQ